MNSLNAKAQYGKAVTVKKTFSRETAISIEIDSDAAIVWSLLTHAADYPRWNSTIISMQGEIEEGEKIQLISTLDPERTFKLKIKEATAEQKLVWGDAMGKRTYTIEEQDKGVVFTMHEKIGGPVFPLFANKIPPFDESFETFASDLKKEAESIARQAE